MRGAAGALIARRKPRIICDERRVESSREEKRSRTYLREFGYLQRIQTKQRDSSLSFSQFAVKAGVAFVARGGLSKLHCQVTLRTMFEVSTGS